MNAAALIDSYLSSQGLTFERSGDAWILQLHGERKHSIPVSLSLREKTLALESFFMRRPLENGEEFYRILLARNLRPSRLRFAVDTSGDAYLIGELSLDALDEAGLDALLGELLYTCEQMFDAAIAVGFSSYLEKDRAWRAEQAKKENSADHRESPSR